MCALSSRSARNGADNLSSHCAENKSNGVAINRGAKGGLTALDNAANLVTLVPSLQNRRLRKLVQMIEQEPTGNIQNWALAFNLSQSYLRHLFKQATGLSLNHVLTEQRLQKAARLLADSNLSIKEIAGAVGYEHTSSFTRAFERRFEKAPRSYRHENGWT